MLLQSGFEQSRRCGYGIVSGVAHLLRAPLSGRTPLRRYPGLKPWAVLSDHFMVKESLLIAYVTA
ncbi:MAG: hypothetical protein WAK31_12115 [Chthoniobacterales bacterium]